TIAALQYEHLAPSRARELGFERIDFPRRYQRRQVRYGLNHFIELHRIRVDRLLLSRFVLPGIRSPVVHHFSLTADEPNDRFNVIGVHRRRRQEALTLTSCAKQCIREIPEESPPTSARSSGLLPVASRKCAGEWHSGAGDAFGRRRNKEI